jgi:DNA-directed RNA polymerase subunit RPC12/RpoP
MIDDSKVFKTENKQWARKCPVCSSIIIYKGRSAKSNALRDYNKRCHSCANKRPHTEQTKIKLSKIRQGKYTNVNNPFYGKCHSEKTKKLISKLKMGNKNYWFGKTISNETKRKIRIAVCERLRKLGIVAGKDKGANEWFSKINQQGYNFEQGYHLKEQGYFADGYDKENHIWVEYDTSYHNILRQKKKDLVRQNNIIQHFKNINEPLKEFVRVKDDGCGNLKLECIHKG